MALKKSELYGSLWSSCDELRGGMDASQYKDYVLSLLFIKYISDKYAGRPYAPIAIPPGASFADMVALKGKTDIGDQINKKIIAPLASANDQLSQADFPDFNDPVKLGDGKEKVDRLTNLIAIFENPSLNFSKNRADGDDILGDAYEYLMRHFATESGKSKGQFYTPAEVSRVIAQVIGIRGAPTTTDTTVYDPTCGSGSLLLKVADEAATDVTIYGQETGANTETDRQVIYSTYQDLLKGVEVKPNMTKTETYEEWAKGRFVKEPANMKLLIVVDKLLTGFDAPSCTYLYIDKSMQDHGLFQAICRTNRLDGEDKEFGYVVDYKDLFKKVEKAIAVYTSELDHSAGGADPEVLLQDRLTKGRERLDEALEAIVLLCEPVEPPQGELEHIRYFCGNTEIPSDLEEKEPQRAALYKATASLVRAYAGIADEMEPAGYGAEDIARIKRQIEHYLDVREIIRKASGEILDLKAYEADMRHLIDTYIEAEAPRKISLFDNMSLLQLIVKSGIAEAIATQLDGLKGNKQAIAETIENNVRSKIIKEHLSDPAYYEKLSVLLDEIIADRKAKAIEYEEYLKRIAVIAERVQAGQPEDTPQSLNTPGRRALYNNLGQDEGLALKIDEVVKSKRPDGWRGVQAREQVVKKALYDVLKDVDEVERIFVIIKAQKEY